MPRAPSDKVPKAENLYRTGMPLAEIAVKAGVPLNIVWSWRSRYGWKKLIKVKKMELPPKIQKRRKKRMQKNLKKRTQ